MFDSVSVFCLPLLLTFAMLIYCIDYFLSLFPTCQIMNDTAKVPNIKQSCHAPNRLSDLQNLSTGLEKCQKSLNDYLDSKRNAFPRFFFISDDELLSILGSSDPNCVQEHMIKVNTEIHVHRCQGKYTGKCIRVSR